jgi:hypothetical protein
MKREQVRLCKQIAICERKRLALKKTLLRPKPMLEGAPVAKYTRCGTKGCLCHEDESAMHGPYWYLTFQREGKSKSRYIGKDEKKRKKVFAYKRYQSNLAELRKLNKVIDEYFVALRDLYLERPDES